MRIGVTCYPVPGGSGVVATELGIELAKRGHQVHFITYSPPFRLQRFIENLYYHQVEVSNYPLFKFPPYTLSLACKMAEIAELWSLDLLHAHYAIPHATAAFLAKSILKEHSPKVITTLHGTDITLVGADQSFRGITKFSIEESDGVTTVSEFLKKRTRDEFGLKNEIEMIPNFVDTERFIQREDQARRRQFAKDEERILMHISNFRPVKRVEDIIKIFHLIDKKLSSKLVLIGDGPDLSKALSLSRDFGIEDKVISLGGQDYVENLLPLADLFLLPSDQESFGLVALEAMSCGVPVIATKTGGLPEVVIDGENGFLGPLGDVGFMANKGIELLSDENRLNKFRENCRKRAVEKFDSKLIVPKYEKYYEKVIGHRP
ncbi:MAG: N-acetyl-alpha-D-glucosaminyl L-malate synthase BshA [candidate division Zixibacteria bacterium RBG_16_43_9]|nr:MAG: N-acetyl-alpha-D-glucosaminyl L-malate synthase BshA [candidate division Zixibacteria bacterium RBG_16_43_9]